MKVFFSIALRSTLLLFVFLSIKSIGQTMTGTVLTQPCNNNGSIGVTVTGLTPPISYTYANFPTRTNIIHNNVNSTTDIVTGLGGYNTIFIWGYQAYTNSWDVTASDGTNTATYSTSLTPAFDFTTSAISANCPAMGTVQAIPNSSSSYSYLWTNNGSPNNANIGQTFTSNPAVVPEGWYSLVLTENTTGCRVSTSYSTNPYVYSQSPVTISFTGTPANCTNGTAIATASNGIAPYTYLWSNGATTPSIGGLTQGLYYCQAMDSAGCLSNNGIYTLPQSINFTYNSSVTNATCIQANGSILSFVSGGTAPYTYLWDNGAITQNIAGLVAGSYQTLITDANGCTGSGTAQVSSTTPITVTYSVAPSSCTLATGGATVFPTGGVAPYTIIWYTYPTTTTGNSIINMPSGTYSFKVTDANGCIQNGSAYIPPISTFNIYVYSSNVVCPANTGNINLNNYSSAPPFTYLWNNGATTSNLTNVPLGFYSCVITDAVGCSVTKYASVSQTSPLTIGLNSVPASCIYSNDGSAYANTTGGVAPYSYSWSNGQIGANAHNLTTDNYYVFVTDANGCTNTGFTNVGYNTSNNSCYCTIKGTVYADANNNCIQDAGETGIQNIQVHATGLGYTYTDATGVYSFMAPTGTYTITETVQQIYPLAACQSNNQTVSVTSATNCYSTVNFANTIVPIHDLHVITTSINQPIPGNIYNQKIIVQNEGTVTENNIQFGYTHDGQLSYNNCTPWSLAQQNAGTYPNWYSINSGFPSINAGSSSASFIDYNVPTNIPLNTVVNFYDSVSHSAPINPIWLTDNTPWNNVDNHQTYVIGSFDPNFKEVTPKGIGAQGNITVNDSVLTYVIHFQNTGSYFAQNIVVVDSLDSDLIITSLKPGYSDHQYTTTMNENGVIKFNFKNINLAWKTGYGDIMSSGMVTYSIKLKKNLALGTQIKNKAAIYFDYNAPIITNTTLNTLAVPTSINGLQSVQNTDINLYPNPTDNQFNLQVFINEKTEGVLSIFDISGREVSNKHLTLNFGNNTLTENVTSFQNGVYFVQLKSNQYSITKKLIISK